MAATRSEKILRLNTFWDGSHLSKLGVSYYIDNECSPKESRKIWDHLRKCAKCRLKVGRTVSIDRLARKSLPSQSPEALPKLLARLGLKP